MIHRNHQTFGVMARRARPDEDFRHYIAHRLPLPNIDALISALRVTWEINRTIFDDNTELTSMRFKNAVRKGVRNETAIL